jgi:hypothetical protein
MCQFLDSFPSADFLIATFKWVEIRELPTDTYIRKVVIEKKSSVISVSKTQQD